MHLFGIILYKTNLKTVLGILYNKIVNVKFLSLSLYLSLLVVLRLNEYFTCAE